MLRRAYQPLYRATAEGKRLQTLAVNLTLLGVPGATPGTHKVEIAVSAGPEKMAGIAALAGAAGSPGTGLERTLILFRRPL